MKPRRFAKWVGPWHIADLAEWDDEAEALTARRAWLRHYLKADGHEDCCGNTSPFIGPTL